MTITFVEQFKKVDAFGASVTTNGLNTSDVVKLTNANRVTVSVKLKQAVAHATVITLYQATDLAGTGGKVLSGNAFVWANEDLSATDTLVRQSDAKNFTVAATAKPKEVVFELDLATCLDHANGFGYLYMTTSASSQATNFVSGEFLLHLAYQKASPATAIA